MSIYALVQKNKVVNLVVADKEWIAKEWNAGDYYESTELRPIVLGSELINGRFFAPQPYPSWTLDENQDWQPPTQKPDGDAHWDEETQTWLVIRQAIVPTVPYPDDDSKLWKWDSSLNIWVEDTEE